MLTEATPEAVRAIVARLIELAGDGDVQAARLILDRVLGPAQTLDTIDRLEELDRLLAQLKTQAGVSRA